MLNPSGYSKGLFIVQLLTHIHIAYVPIFSPQILRQANEFEAFRADGYWPVRAFIYTVLKSSSEKHKRLQKRLKSGPEDKDASNPPLSNNNKPASQHSKPTLNRSGNVIADLKGEMAIPAQDYVEGRKKVETTRAFASEPRTATDNDNDEEELAVGLSSMVLEPIDTAGKCNLCLICSY